MNEEKDYKKLLKERLAKEAKEKKEALAALRRKYGLLGGRPVKFKTPKEMEDKYLEFLYEQDNRKIDVVSKGGQIVKVISPAPRGLELFCVFAGITKTTFYDYAKKKKFKWITDVISGVVEAYYVEQLTDGKPGNKADFVLKNAFAKYWKESSETIHSGEIKTISVEFVDNPSDSASGENRIDEEKRYED